MTNRLDWNEVKIAKMYSRRWEIVAQRGQVTWIEDCQLRSDEAISKYAEHLSRHASRNSFSALSPVIQIKDRTPEVKHRRILLELVSQLISSASKVKDDCICMKHIVESIIYPYKSTLRNKKSGVMG